jgi:PAS domain-containing protein
MHTSTTAFDLLYVTDEGGDRDAIADALGVDDNRLTLATSVGDATERMSDVDCVLCGDSAESGWCLDVVRTLRNVHPGIPVVVFTGDSDGEFVDEILRAGATDVIQMTAADAPASLIRTRVEGVLSEGSVRSERGHTVERYETILNTAADAIYQLDAEGTIVAVNDAVVDLMGYDRSELVVHA